MSDGNGKATLKSIADELGVTPSVVSRVMRNNSTTITIGQETKRKILELAIEKGIRLNNNIAVFIPDFGSENESYFHSFLSGIMLQANEYKYGVFCGKTGPDGSDRQSGAGIPEFLLKKEVNAAIFLHAIPDTLRNYLDGERIPYVLANPTHSTQTVNSVVFDDYGTMRELLDHLKEQSYRDYYLISYAPQINYVKNRVACFDDFMRENSFFGRTILDQREALTDIPALMGQASPDTVFIADARLYTMKLLESLVVNGKQLPRDVGLVGSPFLAEFYHPRLTTVTNPNFEMGAACIDMVDGIWRGKNRPRPNRVIKGRLRINQSTTRG